MEFSAFLMAVIWYCRRCKQSSKNAPEEAGFLRLRCSMVLMVDQSLVPQDASVKAACSQWLEVERA